MKVSSSEFIINLRLELNHLWNRLVPSLPIWGWNWIVLNLWINKLLYFASNGNFMAAFLWLLVWIIVETFIFNQIILTITSFLFPPFQWFYCHKSMSFSTLFLQKGGHTISWLPSSLYVILALKMMRWKNYVGSKQIAMLFIHTVHGETTDAKNALAAVL